MNDRACAEPFDVPLLFDLVHLHVDVGQPGGKRLPHRGGRVFTPRAEALNELNKSLDLFRADCRNKLRAQVQVDSALVLVVGRFWAGGFLIRLRVRRAIVIAGMCHGATIRTGRPLLLLDARSGRKQAAARVRVATTPAAHPRMDGLSVTFEPSHILRPLDEPDDVVLLDEHAQPCGRASRRDVHTTDTPLHLAFSFHAVDAQGLTLMTRRALGKAAWPGVWSNACCGHPRPGEQIEDAVRRRVFEELGAQVESLTCILPDFRYRAVDASGVVENEICPVFVGSVGGQVRPDPAEVMEHTWAPWSAVSATAAYAPALISPWAVLQYGQLPTSAEDPLLAAVSSSP